MNEQPWLVTTCVFKGNQFLVKMNTNKSNCLELSIIDKYSGEEWCSKYDCKFIENLTLKTGNYKRFDIFLAMLKSGLLRTSECVSLDLLTFEDLELLRGKKKEKNCNKIETPESSRGSGLASTNRRYLILTYTVEFDRIHYPLPMDYVGPPNPRVLQATIRRLETEIQKLQTKLNDKKENSDVGYWKDRVKQLEAENWILQEEVAHLRHLLTKQTGVSVATSSGNIPVALHSLEEQVKRERSSFRATLQGLQEQNHRLRRELDELKCNQTNHQKPEPAYVLWRRRGRSPASNNPQRKSDNSDVKSPHAYNMMPQCKNQVWKTRLRDQNLNGMKPETLPSDKRNRVENMNKHTLELSSRNLSEPDVHRRNRSPAMMKPQPSLGDTSCGPHFFSKAQQRHPVGSGCWRTSSSSDCSSRVGRKQTRRQECKRSRTSSQASVCSATSSSSVSSISTRNRFHRRNAQGDMGVKNQPKMRSPMARADKLLRPKCQPKHRRDCQKTFHKGTANKMSDLETRIIALQHLLKEGMSFP